MSSVAVLIPCYNEEGSVAKVVRDFKAQLPDAEIYVYDNNSTDRTADEARRAGAIVRFEPRQGKGNVIRTMFRDVNADLYIMVDGDGTYPADRVHELLAPVAENRADMSIGSRLHRQSRSAFKVLNLLGNKGYRFLLNMVFRVRISDLLSGYRAFNRRVVTSLPLLSTAFEIETELTVKCLERNLRIIEIPVDLALRTPGSSSKIRIVRDGLLILNTIFALFRDYQPFRAFGILGLTICAAGLIPGIVVIVEFLKTGLILRIPSAILAVGLVLSGLLIAFVGLILQTVARRFQEIDYHLVQVIERLRASSPDGK